MDAIRVKIHLDSETVCLPELKPLVGKDVEIIVLDETHARTPVRPKRKRALKEKRSWFDLHFGAGWPDDKNDGFEEALEKWRRQDVPGNLPE